MWAAAAILGLSLFVIGIVIGLGALFVHVFWPKECEQLGEYLDDPEGIRDDEA